MRRELAVVSRTRARLLAWTGAAASFGLALYTSATESMPEFRIYDGYWMLLGATAALAATAPVVWRLRREVSLLIVVLAAFLGGWAPLVIFALRKGINISERLAGARYLMAADVVSAAITVGAGCLWLALREPGKR
jgi:hypothetical protein